MRDICFILLVLLIFASCKHTPFSIKNAESIAIPIDTTCDKMQDSAYIASLTPIKNQVEKELNVVIGYAPTPMNVNRPESVLSNWAADALRQVAMNITGKNIDVGIVNIGGLRCDWPSGNITKRNVFELMPFDNELCVLTLKGENLINLCQCFAKVGGEGISGLRMNIKNGKAQDIFVGNKPIAAQAYYTIATSDYLALGNDNMQPLTEYTERYDSGKTIRDLYINFIVEKTAQNEPIQSALDGRTTVLE